MCVKALVCRSCVWGRVVCESAVGESGMEQEWM